MSDAREVAASAAHLGMALDEFVWSAEPLPQAARAALAEWVLGVAPAQRPKWAWWLLLSAHELDWRSTSVRDALNAIFVTEVEGARLPVSAKIAPSEVGRVLVATAEIVESRERASLAVADFLISVLDRAALPQWVVATDTVAGLIGRGKIDPSIVIEPVLARSNEVGRDLLAIRLQEHSAIGVGTRAKWISQGSPSVRRFAIEISGEASGDTPELTARILALGESDDVEDRVAVARYLRRTPLACTHEVLPRLARDASAGVRALTMESLAARMCRSERAKVLVSEGLRDQSPRVRLLSIAAVETVFADQQAIGEVLRDVVADSDDFCRCAAFCLLIRSGEIEARTIGALAREIGSGPESSVNDIIREMKLRSPDRRNAMSTRWRLIALDSDEGAVIGAVIALDALGYRGELPLTPERAQQVMRNPRSRDALRRITE